MKRRNVFVLICLVLILTMSLTLAACDKNKKYTVKFSGEGIEATTQSVESGNTVSKPADPVRDGYIFDGWLLDGNAYDFNTPVTKDIELIANWKVIFAYTLKQDGTYSIAALSDVDYDTLFGTSITLPSSFEGVAVTEVGDMQYLTNYEVIIPASVKSIAAGAFKDNGYIGVVDMSAFTGTVGDEAFANSEVKIIDLGATTSIGKRAFKNSQIKSVSIPATVTTLGDEALLSLSIVEIAFMGNVPTLGNNVFGDGKREDSQKLRVIATEDAWNVLIDGADNTDNAAISAKTGLTSAVINYYSTEEMAVGISMEGIYRAAEDGIVVYKGVSLNAILYEYLVSSDEITLVELYDDAHFYTDIADLTKRQTYFFNQDKTLTKLQKNDKGEVIKDGVLYDYLGSDSVYIVPNGITKVAGGAGRFNQDVRFVEFVNDVTEIGEYAFSDGMLFGVTLGEKVEKIEAYAVFGHDHLQQIIFLGETAPTIGTAAFCTQLETQGIGPSILLTKTALSSGNCYVYTTLSTWGWNGAPADVIVEALNESLKELAEDGLLPTIKENPDDEGKLVEYTSSNLRQLSTYDSDFYKGGKQYETPYGTITMAGTNPTGYATIEFSDDSEFSGTSYVYYKSMNLPGYKESDANDPKEIEVMVKRESGFYSFKIYGRLMDGKFIERGIEAGSFGEVGDDTLMFDGFGNFSFFGKDGSTTEGSYTVSGNTITFDEIDGTATINKVNDGVTITYKGNTMLALDAAAGVYYDLLNGAKLTIDGRGHATLEFNGEVTNVNYTFKNSYTITVDDFKGQARDWDFSKTSADYVIQMYYNPESRDQQLKFKIVETGMIESFTNGSSTLSFDGYYSVTLSDGTTNKTGTQIRFKDTDTYLLNVDGAIMIAKVNMTNKTFEIISGDETGLWYTASGKGYRWYFDGEGNFIYHYSSSYAFGTYTLDKATGEISIIYNGAETVDGQKGQLDLTNGIGRLVFNSYGNTFAAISRVPFDEFKSTWGSDTLTFSSNSLPIVFGDVDTSASFTFCVTGNTVFAYPYGKPMAVATLAGELNGGSCEFEYVLTSGNTTFKITVHAVFAVEDSVASATISLVGQPQVVTE